MILAFKHRPAQFDLNDTGVSVWTRSPFVHVEVLPETPAELAIAARTAPSHGVVVSPRAEALGGSRWWCCRVPTWSEADVMAFLLAQVGKQFNWPGIVLSQVYGLRLNNQRAWFCSELAYVTCREFSTLAFPDVRPVWVHPGRLRDYCIAAGCEEVSQNTLAK